MSSNSLEAIQQEKETLKQRLEMLDMQATFHQDAKKFSYSPNLIQAIETLINAQETEGDYVFRLVNQVFKGGFHYETEYRGEPDPSGSSSWGESDSYEVRVEDPDKSVQAFVIMDKAKFDLFQGLSFPDADSYENNLRTLASGEKSIFLNHFDLSDVARIFPFVGEFLTLLTNRRIQNGNLDITDEMLQECLAQVPTSGTRGV